MGNFAYYSENDPSAAQWLRNLMKAGLIMSGHVDERSISDVQPDDLAGFIRCSFFSGIGGWDLSLQLAKWPETREVWHGSPPCQPFSVAGKGGGADDPRHLWPDFFRLISARRPVAIFGENVAAAIGKGWIDGVLSDLEGIGYSARAFSIPACATNAPHRRDRLWFVAGYGIMADSDHAERRADMANRNDFNWNGPGRQKEANNIEERGSWNNSAWIVGPDGKARRVGMRVRGLSNGLSESMARLRAGQADQEEYEMIPLLAHGERGRAAKLRGLGNAIVPAIGAEIIKAWMECYPT